MGAEWFDIGPDTSGYLEYQKFLADKAATAFGIPKQMPEAVPVSSAAFPFSGNSHQWRVYSAFVTVWTEANLDHMPSWLGDSRRAVASRLAQAYWDFTEAMARIQ